MPRKPSSHGVTELRPGSLATLNCGFFCWWRSKSQCSWLGCASTALRPAAQARPPALPPAHTGGCFASELVASMVMKLWAAFGDQEQMFNGWESFLLGKVAIKERMCTNQHQMFSCSVDSLSAWFTFPPLLLVWLSFFGKKIF